MQCLIDRINRINNSVYNNNSKKPKIKKSLNSAFFESCTLLPCNTGTFPSYKYQEISMDTEQESNQMLRYHCQ